MHELGRGRGDGFDHIGAHAPGMDDGDIPQLCRRLECDSLITINVRDFGAKKVLYEALLAAGVSVVVMRHTRGRLTAAVQLGVLALNYDRVRRSLADGVAKLIVATISELRVRDLEELITEVGQQPRRLP